jgi:predicted metal-dependent phosphoesterase TrpH
MKLADLHLHTNFSDGTLSPQELVEEAKKAGLSCISVTDHDSVSAIKPIQEILSDSLEFISGIELTAELHSVRDKTIMVSDDCRRQSISNGVNSKEIHILGYFINPDSLSLTQELKKINEIRKRRVHDILEKLKTLGVNLEPKDVFDIAGQGSVGRLHIARAMLVKGIISNIYEAFSKYIGNGGPAYVGKFSLTPDQAIELIREAGGISVLAHPYSSGCDEWITSFIKAGLRGIEVYYPEHSEAIRHYYLGIAEKYGLLVTGGSDCHGTAKPDIKVGSVSIPYELVEKLKEARNG